MKEMKEIPINDESTEEVHMIMDSLTTKKYTITIISTLLFVIFCAIIGIFGPPEAAFETKRFELNYENETNIYITFDNIKPNFQRIFGEVSFRINQKGNKTDINYPFVAHLIMEKSGRMIKRKTYTPPNPKVFFYKNRNDSFPFPYLLESEISFDKLEVHFEFPAAPDFDFAQVSFEHDDPKSIFMQLCARYLYIVFAIIMFVVYSLKCKRNNSNSLVQKMTKMLIATSIAGFDIIYAIEYTKPSMFLLSLDMILFSFFMAFTKFYALLIFDDIRLRNTVKGSCFIVPKAIFFVVNVLVETFFLREKFNQQNTDFNIIKEIMLFLIIIMKLQTEIIFVIWLVTLFIYSIVTMQGEERKSTCLVGYIFLFSVALSILEIFPFKTFLTNSLNFMLLFGTSTVVVFAMFYLTLPFSKDDISYQKEEGNEEGGTTTFEPDIEMPEETNDDGNDNAEKE